MPRKKKVIRVCERCGSWMEETETGWQCPTCHLTEWIQEDGTYTSGLAHCPACHNMSPNSLICSYCAYPIDKHMRKLFEEKKK
jgi:ribosomal protein S27AE